ncbi:hypothetical protein DL89DRAFT_41126 [Linderina pennispora]|uniref:Uncharacterized protein n=1 Tax=Linderina pennispora TaxID=61395 RepID=A0A1Y1W3B6_9FUNG|nr:uncharacterized protein DL89DRAFT_41126 [Linderina pennispora]ORX68043.1 hypothetical protein DL89DRAFT_41126 [Linderina pennispora]
MLDQLELLKIAHHYIEAEQRCSILHFLRKQSEMATTSSPETWQTSTTALTLCAAGGSSSGWQCSVGQTLRGLTRFCTTWSTL